MKHVRRMIWFVNKQRTLRMRIDMAKWAVDFTLRKADGEQSNDMVWRKIIEQRTEVGVRFWSFLTLKKINFSFNTITFAPNERSVRWSLRLFLQVKTKTTRRRNSHGKKGAQKSGIRWNLHAARLIAVIYY